MAMSMSASALTLRWNPGSPADRWDAASMNWLDGSTPTAWVPGADAMFDGAPQIVEVAGDIEVGDITFMTNGHTLGGEGRLRFPWGIPGTVFVTEGTTNTISAELYAPCAVHKEGGGACVLGKCVGIVFVYDGTLLVGASEMTDAEIFVVGDAELVTFGGPDPSANLIVNGGFEDDPQPNGNWRYVTSGANIEPWVVAAYSQFVGRVNSVGAGEWVSTGSAPEGDHVLILQYNAEVQQAFTVQEEGWHTVAFSYFLRRNYNETLLTVLMDGKAVSSFINDAPMFSHKRHASVPIWLTAGTHVLGLRGEGEWGDRTSLIDDVCVAKPSVSMPCLALGGDSKIVLTGNSSATLNHKGNIPLANLDIASSGGVSGTGTWGPDPAKLWYEYTGGVWSATPTAGPDAILRANDVHAPFPNVISFPTDLARRAWFSSLMPTPYTLTSPLVLTNGSTGLAPRLTVTDATSLVLSSPLAMHGTNFAFDAYGEITLQDSFAWMQGAKMSKHGFGPLSFAEPLGMQGTQMIFEGDLVTPGLTNSASFMFSSRPHRSAGLVLTQPANITTPINFAGRGTPKLTMATAGVITNSNNIWLLAPETEIEIADGGTFSQLRFFGNGTSRGISPTGFIKSGPGTLEIRDGGTDTGNSRSYQGRTTLRNGTLAITADATANIVGAIPYNNTTANGRGGTLGCGPATNAVIIGDSGTLPTDALTFIASGNNRFIAHDFEVFDTGASVTFATTNTFSTMFAGTFKLHRDISFTGPDHAHLALGPITHESDFNGTGALALDGFASLQLDGTVPPALHLNIGTRTLLLSPGAILDYTFASFAAGSPAEASLIELEFNAGANDNIQADDLTLGNIAIRLLYGATAVPFSEPGTYTLFRYTTFNGDVQTLSVENPDPSSAYTFQDTGAAIQLVIAPASGMTAALWVSPVSGDWGTPANWYGTAVPNGPTISTLLGSAINANATVTLDAPFTVGALLFNNALHAYTLDGAPLTVPAVNVLGGSHVIRNTLAGGNVTLSAAPGALLTLDGPAAIQGNATVSGGTLAMDGEASVQGELTLAPLSTANLLGSNITLNALSGQGLLTLNNAALTLNQQQPSRFEGPLRGPGGSLTKDGPDTLTLAGTDTPFAGPMNVQAGILALEGASAIGGAALSAGAALETRPATTNGLMGYYYHGNPQASSNAFLSVAALEAYLQPRKPDLISPSGLDGAAFNYANVSAFPRPFGQGGTNPDNFTAVWRGTLTLPESGLYGFRTWADDFHLFAINGEALTSARQYVNTTYHTTALLNAGRHDILAAVGQMSGGAGIRIEVRRPSTNTWESIPNDWLTPAATVTALTGDGTLDLAHPDAILQLGSATASTFNGSLTGVPGATLAKNGPAALTLAGSASGAFESDLHILGGSLILNAPGLFSDATALHLAPNASAILNAPQTVGALTGSGTLNGQNTIYSGIITGDHDSGLSTGKTYTHLANLPVGNSQPATINDVHFDNRGSWNFVDTPFLGAWNGAPDATVTSGIARLTWLFNHGAQNVTLEVTGLTPGKAYEYRQYFRNFNNNNRILNFTFRTGDTTLGTLTHDPDHATAKDAYSFVACAYSADASGTLTVNIFAVNSNDTCHFYGFSNEALPDNDERLATTLTVAPAAGQRALYTGNPAGLGRIIKDGLGAQAFSGTNTMAGGLDINAGNAVLLPGATLSGPAAISAGGTLSIPFGDITLGGLSGDGTLSLAGPGDTANGLISFAFFTNDVQTGISPEKRYTHAVSFGTAPTVPVINGVTFLNTSALNWTGPDGYGWEGAASSGIPGHPGGYFPNNFIFADTNGVYHLLNGMNYGDTNMRLTGLKPGTSYELRIYNRVWQSGSLDRTQTIGFTCDLNHAVTNAIVFNPDCLDPNALVYRYVPEGTELQIIIRAKGSTQTFHFYGFTNEEIATPAEAPAVLDLHTDATFGGAVTGTRGWEKRGPATLLLTGDSPAATGPLAVTQGALGILGGGRATSGPVLAADGTLLFGHGIIGADVTLASGASLQAGTANTCGILATSGDLLITDGAQVRWRYASTASADTFTIGGLLTLPETGTIYAQALNATKPPAKWPLFSSLIPIDGPATLAGWTLDGHPKAKLGYSADKTTIYVLDPRGTVLLIR